MTEEEYKSKDTKRDINMGVEAYYQAQELTKRLDELNDKVFYWSKELSDKVFYWSKEMNKRIYGLEKMTGINHDKVKGSGMTVDFDKLDESCDKALEAYHKVNEFEKKLDVLKENIYEWSKKIVLRLDALEKNIEIKNNIKVKEFYVIEDLDEVHHNIEEYLGEFFTDGRLEAADDIVRIIKGEDVSIL